MTNIKAKGIGGLGSRVNNARVPDFPPFVAEEHPATPHSSIEIAVACRLAWIRDTIVFPAICRGTICRTVMVVRAP